MKGEMQDDHVVRRDDVPITPHVGVFFRHLFLWVALILIQCVMFTPPLLAMDLMEAYTRAKSHDPAFGASQYEHLAAMTLPLQGRSVLLPEVSASGSYASYDFGTAPEAYLDYTSRTSAISLRQPLFNLSRFYEYRQYGIRGNMGEEKFISAQQDLILRVAEAYFNALAASDMLRLIDSEKTAVVEQREQAQKMYQAGVGTVTDVHEAQARYETVLSKEVEAQNALDIRMQVLKKIVGIDPGGLKVLQEDIPLSIPEPENLEGWIEKAQKHHPHLKSSAYQVEYQQAELGKHRGQYWPSVDLVAGYNMTNSNNLIETKDTYYSSVGVRIEVPLFNGGYTWAKVKESKAVLGQAKKEYERMLSDITEKLTEAFLGIRGSIARTHALAAAVRSASTALHSNKKGLVAGIRTTTDVLNAQRELNDVRSRLLQARYEYLMNIILLKSSAGILSESDLSAVNQWLQNNEYE